MNKTKPVIAVIWIISLVFAAAAFGQAGMHWRGGGGWGMGAPYGKMYDPKTVETISGEVEQINYMTPMKGMAHGVRLIVKTDTGTLSVHLGPDWYIENQDVQIKKGEKVEVTGSRVTIDGKPVIIAKDVRKGDEILKLRDEGGYPVWSGWRKR